MINLIPPSAQKEVKKEYWLRVFSVWLVLGGSACAIAAILYAPAYVLIRSQLDAFLNEYTQANHESESYKEAEKNIVEANETAQLLSVGEKDVTFSAIIDDIEAISGEEIYISEIALSRGSEGVMPITILGTSNSRLALTTFQGKLEDHPRFKNVVLPLSNLARDKDIAFTITVALEHTQP